MWIVLHQIQSFFGVGSVSIRGTRTMAVYCVSNLQDLLGAVIPHFEKFPLITQKQIDFELFKKIVVLVSQKQHLTPEGLNRILGLRVAYATAMNLGLSEKLRTAFPNIPRITRPTIPTLTAQPHAMR